MARVTVEDCILNIPNRFDLVIMAAQRAKQISSGNPLTIDRDNDKDGVVSLREIAERTIPLEQLRENVVLAFCKRQSIETLEKAADEKQVSSQETTESFEEVKNELGGAKIKPASGFSFEDDNLDAED